MTDTTIDDNPNPLHATLTTSLLEADGLDDKTPIGRDMFAARFAKLATALLTDPRILITLRSSGD